MRGRRAVVRCLFEDFCLDIARRELSRGGKPVRLEPQVFDLLEFLVRNRDQLVTRDDLIAGVWDGRIVSESALATRINAARAALGDSGEQQRLIKTIPRKGLRFVGTVREEAPSTTGPPVEGVAMSLPDRPSIAVLAFDNLGGDPAEDYFAEGVVEGIINGLCRTRWLFVIARNSSFTYKGRGVAVPQIGRELGVRYVLEGSVQRAGGRIRLSARLVEAASGASLWADRFEGVLEDVFTLQDEIAAFVVGALAPSLEQAEIARAGRKPAESLDAYDLYLRALAKGRQGTREALDEALRLGRASIAADPGFALAHIFVSMSLRLRFSNGWVAEPQADAAEAQLLARRALETGRDDPLVLADAAMILAFLADDPEGGADLLGQALSLDPNLALGWLIGGWFKVWEGDAEEAIVRLARAMRLSPRDPLMSRMQAGTAAGHLIAGRLEEARLWAERALRSDPQYGPALRVATAALALAGRMEEAKAMMARLLAADPGLCAANLRDRAPWRGGGLATLLGGLRRAGLPE